MYDYHVHSTYSDGTFLEWMVEAAADAGLDGVGFADHCNVTPTESARTFRREMGFNLDLTYERRREAIEQLDEAYSLAVFDAVEVDYEPDHEEPIRSFLAEAGFDYAIGSVHDLDGVNVHVRDYFGDLSESRRAALVDRYFDKLVALAESELFEIAAHPDLIERNPHLRGFATTDHYERAAAAFADSRTAVEINAGRVLDEYGALHPTETFLDTLLAHDVSVTLGTDSHEPDVIAPRRDVLVETAEEHGIAPTAVHGETAVTTGSD
ncbi:PHP domain-containing protein [Halobaculum sp. MBLA0147]|uniref:PHP domain-containing protein n=1 Tax=Halobaculum sp. MBLA0147 TaxID=3079934 RepID=UPI003526AA26